MNEIDNILRLKDKAVESFISDRGVYASEWNKWLEKVRLVPDENLPKEISDRALRAIVNPETEEATLVKDKAQMILESIPNVDIEIVFPSMFDGQYKDKEYKFDYKVYSLIREVYREALEKEVAKVQEYL